MARYTEDIRKGHDLLREAGDKGWRYMAIDVKNQWGRRGTVEPLVPWGPWDPRAHGFESWPRFEWRLGIHSG